MIKIIDLLFLCFLFYQGDCLNIKYPRTVSIGSNRFQSKPAITQLSNINDFSVDKFKFSSTLSLMFMISAPLGVMLDNQHGLFNVLDYSVYNMAIIIDNVYYLKSALWVPFLFGFAGVVMSAIVLLLDQVQVMKTPMVYHYLQVNII